MGSNIIAWTPRGVVEFSFFSLMRCSSGSKNERVLPVPVLDLLTDDLMMNCLLNNDLISLNEKVE